MEPIIGIVSHLDRKSSSPLGCTSLGNPYIASITKAGGLPMILPSVFSEPHMEAYIKQCDGFLFSGGMDITPVFYEEDAHKKLGATSMELDRTQLPFMKKVLQSRKPVLGICRGHQVLNVACGGTLYQDISELEGAYIKHHQETDPGDVSHEVLLASDSILSSLYGKTIWTNSYHHQAVKNPGEHVRIIAHAKDGTAEAIQLEQYPFGLGIQWHPEVMFAHGDESMRPLFEAFIQASIQQAGKRIRKKEMI